MKNFPTDLPVSRRSREVLIMTAIKFPNALMQIRTFNARDAPLPLPNNFWKNRAAAICFELRISSRDAAEKYATLTRMYSTVTRIRENGALQRRVLIGFYPFLSFVKRYSEWYSNLNLVDKTKRIYVAGVREDDLDQGVCGSICRRL